MSRFYETVSLEHSLSLLSTEFQHAAHVMIYAEWKDCLYGRYPFKYAVMMQVRFDGTFGFPGGIVDEGETPEEAVTREVVEEVGRIRGGEQEQDGGQLVILRSDHVMTQISRKTQFCYHFYAKQLPDMQTFTELEAGVLHARDWGSEVMGVVRCPLYTLPNGLGLPGFLGNRFIGLARHQLLESLVKCGLCTTEQVKEAMYKSQQVSVMVTRDNIDD